MKSSRARVKEGLGNQRTLEDQSGLLIRLAAETGRRGNSIRCEASGVPRVSPRSRRRIVAVIARSSRILPRM